MPRYDFRCEECGTVTEDAWVSTPPSPGQLNRLCPDCGEPMVKQPAAPNFIITGYSAKNGYAK